MDLIDFTDLLDDPKDKAEAKAHLQRQGHKLKKRTGVRAKSYKPEPFKPRGIYTGEKKKPLQVIIYDRYTCACSNTWIAPRYSSETLSRVVDSPFTAHYTSAEHTLRTASRFEYHDHKVSVCPCCFNADRTTTDPVLQRMFSLSSPDDLTIPLDFDEWCYPTTLYPLQPAGALSLQKGCEYARAKRDSRPYLGYPLYNRLNREIAEEYSLACFFEGTSNPWEYLHNDRSLGERAECYPS